MQRKLGSFSQQKPTVAKTKAETSQVCERYLRMQTMDKLWKKHMDYSGV